MIGRFETASLGVFGYSFCVLASRFQCRVSNRMMYPSAMDSAQ